MGGEAKPLYEITLRKRKWERFGWIVSYCTLFVLVLIIGIVGVLAIKGTMGRVTASLVMIAFIIGLAVFFLYVIRKHGQPVSLQVYPDRYLFNYSWDELRPPDEVLFDDIIFFKPYDRIIDGKLRKFSLNRLNVMQMNTLETYLKRSATGFGMGGDVDDLNVARLVQDMERRPTADITFKARSVVNSLVNIIMGASILGFMVLCLFWLDYSVESGSFWGVLGAISVSILVILFSLLFFILSSSGFIKKTIRVHPGGISYWSGRKLKFETTWRNLRMITTTPGGQYTSGSLALATKDGRTLELDQYKIRTKVLVETFKQIKDYAWFYRIEINNIAGW